MSASVTSVATATAAAAVEQVVGVAEDRSIFRWKVTEADADLAAVAAASFDFSSHSTNDAGRTFLTATTTATTTAAAAAAALFSDDDLDDSLSSLPSDDEEEEFNDDRWNIHAAAAFCQQPAVNECSPDEANAGDVEEDDDEYDHEVEYSAELDMDYSSVHSGSDIFTVPRPETKEVLHTTETTKTTVAKSSFFTSLNRISISTTLSPAANSTKLGIFGISTNAASAAQSPPSAVTDVDASHAHTTTPVNASSPPPASVGFFSSFVGGGRRVGVAKVPSPAKTDDDTLPAVKPEFCHADNQNTLSNEIVHNQQQRPISDVQRLATEANMNKAPVTITSQPTTQLLDSVVVEDSLLQNHHLNQQHPSRTMSDTSSDTCVDEEDQEEELPSSSLQDANEETAQNSNDDQPVSSADVTLQPNRVNDINTLPPSMESATAMPTAGKPLSSPVKATTPSTYTRNDYHTRHHYTNTNDIKLDNLNCLQWLQHACPLDVVPKILSFCSPQTWVPLSRTNKHFSTLFHTESTWKVLCEDLFKWKEGDPEPSSWKELYRFAPCVPVDYRTIHAALALALPQTKPSSHSSRSSSAVVTHRQPHRRNFRRLRTLNNHHHHFPHLHHHNDFENENSTYHHKSEHKQVVNVRVLLRPGKYHLREAISIKAEPGVVITMETMSLPPVYYHSTMSKTQDVCQHLLSQSSRQAARQSRSSIPSHQILTDLPPQDPVVLRTQRHPMFWFLGRCVRSADRAVVHHAHGQPPIINQAFDELSHDGSSSSLSSASSQISVLDAETAATEFHPAEWAANARATSSRNITDRGAAVVDNLIAASLQPRSLSRATIVLRTRRRNEPAVLVRQGHFVMKNIEINHNCHGIDIWNGNSAIQIQPPLTAQDNQDANDDNNNNNNNGSPSPSAELERVKVTSKSGRGIVCIDGGHLLIRECAIHDCAATGVYVGGPGGSHAVLEKTDVVRNGVGNKSRMSRRNRVGGGPGIARGHSGVYLEQGTAKLMDCNISQNTLTGISAVSPSNAILQLYDSDLIANGTFQLEMPPLGTTARRQSVTQNVNLQAAVSSSGGSAGTGIGATVRSSSMSSSTMMDLSRSLRSGLLYDQESLMNDHHRQQNHQMDGGLIRG